MTESSSKGDDNSCNEIVIEIDCSDYPKGMPYFHMDSSPTTWTVNPSHRKKAKFARKSLEDATANFLVDPNNIKHPITNYATNLTAKLTNKAAPNWVNMDTGDIKSVLKSLKNIKGKTCELHHMLPVWLSGQNDGNLIPMDHNEHKDIHRWWNDKLKEQNSDFLEQLDDCITRTNDPKKKTIMGNATTKMVRRHKWSKYKTKPTKMNLNQNNTTTLAKNLKKAKIDLKIKMDCPCAVPQKTTRARAKQ